MSSPKKFKSCCYCGQDGIKDKITITRDHIPPKAFLTPEEKKTHQLITVPACDKCHQSLSTLDEVAKFIQTICIASMENQVSHPEFMRSAKRTINENGKFKAVLSQAKRTSDCNFKITFPMNFWRDFDNFFVRLSKALYYHETKLILKANNFTVFPVVGFDSNKPIDIIDAIRSIEFLKNELIPLMVKRLYINGAFSYLYAKTEDRQDSCIFIYILRESLIVSVFCALE